MQALRAARVYDGSAFIGPATLLVDGETIVGVEGAHHEPPAGTPVTTYEGTLLPGLMDSHVHLVADGSLGALERAGTLSDDELDAAIRFTLGVQARAGVTTVQDLGDRHYRTLEARALPGLPRVLAAGPALTVPQGHCHYLGGEAAGVEAVRRVVAEHVEHGVDVVKVMATGGLLTAGTDVFGVQFTADELRAMVDQAHGAGLRVLAHAQSLRGARHAVAAGVDGIEHFTGLTEDGLVMPDDLLDEVAAAGVVVDPTMGFDASRFPPPELMPPNLRIVQEQLGLDFASMRATRLVHLARIRARGVTLVSGVDAGANPPKPHGGIWRSLADLVAAGYPVDEALASATSVAVDACGLGEVTGRLAPGLAADVLAVDGDLATDITLLERPVAVLVRGEPVPLD